MNDFGRDWSDDGVSLLPLFNDSSSNTTSLDEYHLEDPVIDEMLNKFFQDIRQSCQIDKGKKITKNKCKPVNMICANCHTTATPIWRKNAVKDVLCNACGL